MNQKLIIAFVLCAFILTACQPADPQPIFTPSAEATATPIPFPATTPTVAASLAGVIWSFAIRPDAAVISFATSKGLELYDLKTFAHLRSLESGENVDSLSWSPDGTNWRLAP